MIQKCLDYFISVIFAEKTFSTMSIYLFITVLSVLATVALTASSSEAVRHVDAKSPTGEFVLIFLTCHYHGNL
jgi:hypothetical protein